MRVHRPLKPASGEAETVGEVRGDAYAQMQMVGHYDMAVDGDLRELALPLAEGLVYGAAGREWDGVGMAASEGSVQRGLPSISARVGMVGDLAMVMR